jgi:hypothetical protein
MFQVARHAASAAAPARKAGSPARSATARVLRHVEEVRVTVPENAGDLTRIKVPLRGLGPHSFYLSVRIRIAGQIEEIGPKYFGT